MTFWNDPARLFPKQSHRWVISFGQHDENNSSAAGGVVNANTTSRFFAKAVEKPSFEIKTTQVKYMHSHAFKTNDSIEEVSIMENILKKLQEEI